MIQYYFMKFKNGFISILFAFALCVTISQIGQVGAVNANHPLTSPIIIPPVTPPIPKLPQYRIDGKVTYKYFFAPRPSLSYGKNVPADYIIVPAENVIVRSINKKTKQITLAKTNKDGIFALVIDKGEYTIDAYDTMKSAFSPSTINVNLQKDLSGISFQSETKSILTKYLK